MNKRNKLFILLLPVSIMMLTMTIIIGYSAWIISEPISFTPTEITGLVDENISDLSGFEVVYDSKTHAPHKMDSISDKTYEYISNNFSNQNMTINYYSSSSSINGWNGPSDAGIYTASYYNKNNNIITEVDFEIKPAEPTPSISNQYCYYNLSAVPDKSKFSVTGVTDSEGNIELVEGSWELVSGSAETIKDDGGSLNSHYSTFVYNFISANPNYNDLENVVVKLYYYSVAYVGSGGVGYFSNLNSAIEAANNGTVTTGEGETLKTYKDVYVIPNLLTNGTSGTLQSVNIFENITINSGTNLYLPYDGETYYVTDAVYSSANDTPDIYTNSNFADCSSSGVLSNRKTIVKIEENIILTNEGSIYIGGVLGIGSQRPSGHVVSSYCEILTGENSKIENYGAIECYGYIKETSSNNSSVLNVYSGSNILEPFVIYDFRGGTFSGQANNQKVLPFSVFDFPNCQIEQIIHTGGVLAGKVLLYANDTFYPASADVIGSSNALFLMTSGTVSFKYTPINCLYTTNDHKTSSTQFNKTLIKTNGEIKISKMNLSVAGISLDTSKYYCPLSYKMNIIIESGEVTLGEKTKFLSGTSLTVNPGAKLSIDSNCMFYQKFVQEATTAGTFYPEGMGPAILINNGDMEINAGFGGIIQTTKSNATITTTSNFSSSLSVDEMISGSSMSRKYYTITGYALGKISTDSEPSSNSLFLASKSYTSQGTWWEGEYSSTTNTETYSRVKTGYGLPCITSDTLITLADGSQKRVDQLTGNEMLLVWDHASGKYTTAKIAYIVSHDNIDILHRVTELKFSDGSFIKIIGEHVFFDKTLNKYIAIDEYNISEYIGHKFLKNDNTSSLSEVTLVDYQTYEEYTRSYEVVTDKHLINFTNGILSTSAFLDPLLNVFDITDNYQYDLEQMQKDIETYGLYTYKDFEGLIDEKAFEMYNAQYLKIAVGKGYITWEDILLLIDIYYDVEVEPLD